MMVDVTVDVHGGDDLATGFQGSVESQLG